MVVVVRRTVWPQSGAQSASPVRRSFAIAAAPAAPLAGIVRNLGFAWRNPARESPPALFGRRHG